MELKLSNVLNNLDEFFKRQEELNITTVKKDIKYTDVYINKYLMNQIFKNFYIDIIQQQAYTNNFKKIFDYSESELLFFRENFKSLDKQSTKDVILSLYNKNLELSKQPKPINLLEDYSIISINEIRNQFENFKLTKINGFTNNNTEFNLKTGDIIQFKNGYNVEMITEILGFDSDGDCYLLWDCYWSPIRLGERFTKVIEKIRVKSEIQPKFQLEKIQETTDLINSNLTKKLNHLKEDYLLNINNIPDRIKYLNTCFGFAMYLSSVYKLSLSLTLQISNLLYNDNTYQLEKDRIKQIYSITELVITIDKILERKIEILKNS
jgi:hypothetical protein